MTEKKQNQKRRKTIAKLLKTKNKKVFDQVDSKINEIECENKQQFFHFIENAHKENYCNFAKIGLFGKSNLKNNKSIIDIDTNYVTFANKSNIFEISL